MRNEYSYYIKTIKPIEKKYNQMCIFYSLFAFNYFKERRDFYNKLLISYYKILHNNQKSLDNIANNLK